MNTVAQITGSKTDQVTYTMEASATAHEAVRLMAEKNIGALVVVENGKIVGLVSERDLARKLVLMARSPMDMLLGDDCRALDDAHNGNGRGNTMAFEAEAK
ncbi:MAG: signal-transduction protein with cAMP-binding, CBS, and nucleotidyltransferase domain [Rhodoferax sp.]|jgi:signal-transduction protein with cAMP-binding, CBS, and nucleotidyltransferase domain